MNRRCLPLALLALVACSAPPYPAYSIEDDAEATAAVVVADAALQAVVRVGRPMMVRVPPSNALRVVVPVRNIDDEQIQILAQISYRDRQQSPIGDETNRQVLTIPAGSTVSFEATSRTDAAQDWVLRLSWNK